MANVGSSASPSPRTAASRTASLLLARKFPLTVTRVVSPLRERVQASPRTAAEA